MTKGIISVLPFSGNIEKIEEKENQPKNENQELSVKSDIHRRKKRKRKISSPVEYSNAKKMIEKFLTCDRIISVPTRIPPFTATELAAKLNITPEQLRRLRISLWCYKKLMWHINLPLIGLYCSTRFYEPVCTGGSYDSSNLKENKENKRESF